LTPDWDEVPLDLMSGGDYHPEDQLDEVSLGWVFSHGLDCAFDDD
jgi:hypothetical protein